MNVSIKKGITMGSDAYIFVHYHHILSNLCILIDYTIPSRTGNEDKIRQLDILIFHKKPKTVSHFMSIIT